MPNAPKTRTFRCSDDLWDAAKAKAALDDRTVTEILINALQEYVKD